MQRATRLNGWMTAAAVALAGVVVLAQGVTLRYTWTKGEQLNYRMTNESTVGMSGLPGVGDMTTSTSIVQMQTMTTDSVAADGAGTVLTKIDSMRLDMATPMGVMSYDSANPPAPGTNPMAEQLGSAMSAVVGQTMTMVVEPSGAIRSLQGLSKMMENAQRGAGGGLGAMSGLNLSDDALRGTMGQAFAWLPASPVKVGDTWQNDQKLPNPLGSMSVATVFTLKGVDAGVARIGFTRKVKMEITGDTGGMTMQIGDGTGEGETTFDTKAGRMVKTVTTMSLPMSMSMAGPDGTPLSIQGTTKTKVTLELVSR